MRKNPRTEKTNMKKNKNNLLRWIVLSALVLLCVLYFVFPPLNAFVNRIAAALSSADVDAVIALIRSFGPWAMAASFLLMVFQSVIAPLPAFLITFANAAVFGWWQGALLSWTSAMTGAGLCFCISRALGRDAVERIAGQGALAAVEGYFKKYGSRTILVCRLLPFVSFDAVSYFAGLTPIRFWPFFLATGLGQLPATVIYSYVGGMLTGGVRYFVTALLCIFALSIAVMIVKRIYDERQSAKASDPKEAEP